jgi:hypothetical protein
VGFIRHEFVRTFQILWYYWWAYWWACEATGGPPGSRYRHLGIKRGMYMSDWSGGVGLVRGMKCGITERSQLF